MSTGWFCESVCSPCCRAALRATAAGAVCVSCDAGFSRRPYGLDLVPQDLPARHPAYSDWVNVQTALSARRARTGNQSPDAEARTRETERLAVAFLELTDVGGRLLDVGCGSGWIADLLRARGADYAGVDPAPIAETYGFPFARAVSDCLPLRDATCDSVLFFSSLDYSLDLDATLAETRRLLAPRGIVAIATPIHATREVTGERLHHHRFLKGDVESALAAVFGSKVRTYEWQPNYHFIWAIRS
jgi:SAM-dependent methyltransferase